MFIPLLSIVFLACFGDSDGLVSLMDLPLTMPKGSFTLDAILTDMDTGDKYYMGERVLSKAAIGGIIAINGHSGDFNIHYNLKDRNGLDNYVRLLVKDTDCLIYQFNNASGTFLPGIKKRLTSMLLAMGPSILYRIDHESIIWSQSSDADVRGTTMKSFTASINNKLQLTYYFKSTLDLTMGIQQPSRIIFSGSDPSSFGSSEKENIMLDIYTQELETKIDYDKIVRPEPGLGCPAYFLDNTGMPSLRANLVHMRLSETIQGATNTKSFSEIYAHDDLKLMRLKTYMLGIGTEAIYDYDLGIVYVIQDGGSCMASAIQRSSPGVNPKSIEFSMLTLFEFDGVYHYLGEVEFEHRPGFTVYAWESVENDGVTSSGKYAKVVKTHYFAETTSTDAFNGYIIVATVITAYNLDATKKRYQVAEKTIRDYMDFQVSENEAEFADRFSLAGCRYFENDMTLTFQLACSGPSCMEFAENNIDLFKIRFRDSILFDYSSNLSPLRVGEVDVTFRSSTIDLRVDILEAPNLSSFFGDKAMLISADSLKALARISASSQRDCFEKAAGTYSDFDVVVYCPQGNICGTRMGFDGLKEDQKGTACQVIDVPLHNLRRIKNEVSNKELQQYFLRNTAHKTVRLVDGRTRYDYKVVDILDETRNKAETSRNLFFMYNSEQKLLSEDPNVFSVPDMKNFADCYRSCASSDELECSTFSFCTTPDSTECLVTNMIAAKAPVDKTVAKSCTTYSKNHLLDYTAILDRRFRVPASVSLELWADQCAAECASSSDCKSFQYCGQICILSGHYTDAATEHDEACEIYIPKVSEQYKATGRKTITDTFFTELNLNLDQCAALCHDWANFTHPCQSFNFCPRGRSLSSCGLSTHSVKDPNTKTIEGNNCFNYELAEKKSNPNKKKQSNSPVKKGTSGSAAFGIIMLFLATGFIFGVGIPIVYSKSQVVRTWTNRSSSRNSQTFTWKRQVDDQAAI